ncbi:sporulation peptidase YabG [Acetivibrio straminisolvens]|jgi:spore coat assembly protein|uniref:sporulation peptidase YabG n=1 Tax=Acetivibrio straminisolvens TaxID=253314 RepID=UPI00223EE785|nr:sporulation peptidase YabG [Acetivibrio straminisolvens]
MSLKIGDIVARKSYGSDILFKVVDIKYEKGNKIVILKGICYRLEADAPETDLVVQSDTCVREYNARVNRSVKEKIRSLNESLMRDKSKKKFFRDVPKENNENFPKPGKVLHIDGDSDYLDTCMEEYRKLGIEAVGVYVREREQPFKIFNLLKEHKPDILVLTGHDGVIKTEKGYSDIENYRNSKYFVEAVREARRFDSNLDSLVIFAGACQSMFKKIIEAGANFASSPYRVLIHALDPVMICEKIAFTSINQVITPQDVINKTITGVKGIGGIETRGKYRDGFPREPYNIK